MRRRVSFELIVTLEEEEEKGEEAMHWMYREGKVRGKEREEWGQNKSRQEWSINVINSPYSFYYWWEAN